MYEWRLRKWYKPTISKRNVHICFQTWVMRKSCLELRKILCDWVLIAERHKTWWTPYFSCRAGIWTYWSCDSSKSKFIKLWMNKLFVLDACIILLLRKSTLRCNKSLQLYELRDNVLQMWFSNDRNKKFTYTSSKPFGETNSKQSSNLSERITFG